MKRTFSLVVVFLLLLTTLASAQIETTDMLGRPIVLDSPAASVVALSPADCEIVFALDAGDALVGRGEYCDYPEAALAAPVLGSGANTNIEEIMALMPDIVLVNTMAQSEEQIIALESMGIPVFTSEASDIEGVYAAIIGIGTVLGKDESARALIENMRTSFEAISGQLPEDAAPKTVYFEVSPLEYGLWTTGTGTFMDELAQMMGLQNIFDDVTGWAEISQEQVIARNPDLIVTLTMYFGEGPRPEEEIAGRPGWQDVSAVKNGKILAADSNAMTRPGPRLVEAAEALYGFAYAQ